MREVLTDVECSCLRRSCRQGLRSVRENLECGCMRNGVLNVELRSLVGSEESWAVSEQENDHRVCPAVLCQV